MAGESRRARGDALSKVRVARGLTIEAELVAAAQTGDFEAFRSLYLESAPQVYAYARRRVGHHEAEDVTAETYARAWRSLHTFRSQGSPLIAWLLRICQRVMIDRSERHVGALPAPTDRAPSGTEETVIERQTVTSALCRLPRRQRQVLELRFLHDQSVTTAAEAMGLTPEGIRALTYRALSALRAEGALAPPPGGNS